MRIISLGSGSRGNSTLVHIDGRYVLIDNGFTLRETAKRLPVNPKEISGILLTHEHSDHIEGVSALAKEYDIPVHIPLALKQVTSFKLDGANVICHNDGEFELDGVKVTSFRVPHDAKYTVGYKLERGEHSFACVTDCGEFIKPVLDNVSGVKNILIESNYDLEMLRGGSYPPALKRRIEGRLGHLSNEECARICQILAKKGTQRFILGHLSENNNIPEVAYDKTAKALSETNKVVFLGVTSQDKVRDF